jgi:hypothetical protein
VSGFSPFWCPRLLGPVKGRCMMPPTKGERASFLLFDIEASSLRDGADQKHELRRAMYSIVDGALLSADVGRGAIYAANRGDGAIYVVSSTVDTPTLIFPFLEHLQFQLGAHNAKSSPSLQMRLRVVLHIGEVYSDHRGFYGYDVDRACAILDASEVKRSLARSSGSLVSVISDDVYELIRRFSHAPIDPTDYAAQTIALKETRASVWLRLRGSQSAEKGNATVDDVGPSSAAAGNDQPKFHVIMGSGAKGSQVGDLNTQHNDFSSS